MDVATYGITVSLKREGTLVIFRTLFIISSQTGTAVLPSFVISATRRRFFFFNFKFTSSFFR